MFDIAFRPASFFRRQLQQPISWPRAGVAPLLCMVLHFAAYYGITSKTSVNVANALQAYGYNPSAFKHVGTLLTLTSSVIYPAIWIVSALFLACTSIVISSGAANSGRLFDLTAYAMYSQVPWLLGLIVFGLIYQPPQFFLGGFNDPQSIQESVRQYTREIQSSAPFVVARVLPLLF